MDENVLVVVLAKLALEAAEQPAIGEFGAVGRVQEHGEAALRGDALQCERAAVVADHGVSAKHIHPRHSRNRCRRSCFASESVMPGCMLLAIGRFQAAGCLLPRPLDPLPYIHRRRADRLSQASPSANDLFRTTHAISTDN